MTPILAPLLPPQAFSPKPAQLVLSPSQKLESAFLSEMLKSTGLGKTPETFGGGAGEDHFSSFLRDAQAREIVRAGGIGLAPYFEAIVEEKSG